MINKNITDEKAKKVKSIAEKFNLVDFVKEIDNFIYYNHNYATHVVYIGGFSSGKSALLNRFIGKNILKENQAPETDIATEIHFGINECLVANNKDGTRSNIDNLFNIDFENVNNIELYVNSDNVQKYNNYIVVDTPGFDSGIEKHNKALMQYISNATAFVIVVDCEKGTISDSAMRFIEEVSNYSDDMTVIINKCDKKIKEEVEQVKQYIENLLETTTGRTYPVICTSIYDDDIQCKLNSVLEGFDLEYLYNKNVISLLNIKIDNLIDALELMKQKVACDTTEIEKEIKCRKEAKQYLIQQLEKQKQQIRNQLHSKVKNNILMDIECDLNSNVDDLVNAYQIGVDYFKSRIVEMIRPVLVREVEMYSNNLPTDFITNINIPSLNLSSNNDAFLSITQNIYDKLKNMDSNLMMKKDVVDGIDYNFGTLYKTLTTTLSIVTQVLSPVLELVIVFLPEIIKVFNSLLGGNSKEQQIYDGIQNKVIPQIISKLQVELDKVLYEVENHMIENITTNVSNIIEIENETLNNALKQKEEIMGNYENYISEINNYINQLKGIKDER